MLIILLPISLILALIFSAFKKTVISDLFLSVFLIDLVFGIAILSQPNYETVVTEHTYTLTEQKLELSEDESTSFYVTKRENEYSFIYYDEVTKEHIECIVSKDYYHELESCEPQLKVSEILSKPAHDCYTFLIFANQSEHKKYEVFVPKGATIEL